MLIEEHKSLKDYNTFGIDAKARFFISVSEISELKEALQSKIHPTIFILGGGSNMLLTKDIDALVIHINFKGIKVLKSDKNETMLEVQAGENWHEFVLYCINNNYGGVENMSLIPGNVGTAPIQNIGAYGVELKDVFVQCAVLDMQNLEMRVFGKEECDFGYRNSIFKNAAKGRFVITSVQFKLTNSSHNLSTSYGVIKQKLEDNEIENPTIKDISDAVIAIRKSKLPDPAELGNSGSFFKNPVVNTETFQKFRNQYPNAPYYEVSSTQFKIPAGWLIEQAGFKGQRYGDAGVHKNQALVLVNYGNATGTEIWELAMKIQKKVREDFGIYIEPEVNVI